jgi:four helix bundle protein
MKARNIILEMSFNFSLKIIGLHKELVGKKEFVISKQLLRSATSIGANVEEATVAQTRKDFIAKMSIASKEARETRYWLRLLDKSKLVNINLNNYLVVIDHIINIITKIVKTSQESINR